MLMTSPDLSIAKDTHLTHYPSWIAQVPVKPKGLKRKNTFAEGGGGGLQ